MPRKTPRCHLPFSAADVCPSRGGQFLVLSPGHSIEVWLELEVNKDPVPTSQPQCMGFKGKHRNNRMHLASAPLHEKLWSLRLGRVRMRRDGKVGENDVNTLKFRTTKSLSTY